MPKGERKRTFGLGAPRNSESFTKASVKNLLGFVKWVQRTPRKCKSKETGLKIGG
jgi:hypothetical protein